MPPYLEQLKTNTKTVGPIPENIMVKAGTRIKAIYFLRNGVSETSIEHVALCSIK